MDKTDRSITFHNIFSSDDLRVQRISSSYATAYTEPDYNRHLSLSFSVSSYYHYATERLKFVIDPYSILLEKPEIEFQIAKHKEEHADDTVTIQVLNSSTEIYSELSEIAGPACVWRRDPYVDMMLMWEVMNPSSGLTEIFWIDVIASALGMKSSKSQKVSYFDFKRIEKARKFIFRSLHEPDLDVEGVASDAALSLFHFIRLFKKIKGVSPRQYIIMNRVYLAKQLLKKGASVTDATFATGFNSIEHFCYAFGKIVGVSPGSYKKSNISKIIAAAPSVLG